MSNYVDNLEYASHPELSGMAAWLSYSKIDYGYLGLVGQDTADPDLHYNLTHL